MIYSWVLSATTAAIPATVGAGTLELTREAPPAQAESVLRPRQDEVEGWRAPFDGPISTDRPDFTEAPMVMPQWRVQLESGATFSFDREADVRTRTSAFPEFLLRVGLGAKTELRLTWEGYILTDDLYRGETRAGRRRTFHEHDDGAADLGIGFKRHLLSQDGIVPELSVIGSISVPSGSANRSSGDVDPEIRILWAYALEHGFTLSGNINSAVLSDEEGHFFQQAASLSLGYSLTEWMGTYVEYFGFYPNTRGTDCAHYVNGGLTFLLTDDLQLDVRAGTGLNEEADDFFAGVGVSFRF